MKIIDNKKDYYDYLSGVYGIDEKVVYDRRGSLRYDDFLKDVTFKFTPPKDKKTGFEAGINRIRVRVGFVVYEFAKERVPKEDVPELKNSREYLRRHYNGKSWTMPKTLSESIGWREIVKQENPRRLTREEVELEHIKEQTAIERMWSKLHKKHEKIAVTSEIPPIEIRMWQDTGRSYPIEDYLLSYADEIIYNPILQDFPAVARFISPETIWQEVYGFITAMSEKVITDNRTDIEHLESAGFDKKTSFRNIK